MSLGLARGGLEPSRGATWVFAGDLRSRRRWIAARKLLIRHAHQVTSAREDGKIPRAPALSWTFEAPIAARPHAQTGYGYLNVRSTRTDSDTCTVSASRMRLAQAAGCLSDAVLIHNWKADKLSVWALLTPA